MTVRPAFNFRLAEEEKEKWRAFADEYTRGRVTKLIKESVEIVMRNPALLDPTRETAQILKDLERGYELDYQQQMSLNQTVESLDHRTKTLENQLNAILEHFGIEIKEPKTLGDLIDE